MRFCCQELFRNSQWQHKFYIRGRIICSQAKKRLWCRWDKVNNALDLLLQIRVYVAVRVEKHVVPFADCIWWIVWKVPMLLCRMDGTSQMRLLKEMLAAWRLRRCMMRSSRSHSCCCYQFCNAVSNGGRRIYRQRILGIMNWSKTYAIAIVYYCSIFSLSVVNPLTPTVAIWLQKTVGVKGLSCLSCWLLDVAKLTW